MALIKTKGIVLKYVNLNDNDRLFTIFTIDMGKITAMSKGIRSHKHKDFAALQLFCYSDLVLDDSKGLMYINSAQLKENFYNLRTMIEKTSLVTYFADLVSFLSDEVSGDEDFFSFILNSIYLTANADERVKENIDDELLRLKTIFETKCVCVSGYMPDTLSCAKCSSKESLAYFDTVGGRSVCKKCFNSYYSPEILECEENALKIIGYICNCDYKSVFSFKASSESVESANKISERYLINKLEYISPALEYYKTL
jgi:DNA repair protein RecO (recombination protein O)